MNRLLHFLFMAALLISCASASAQSESGATQQAVPCGACNPNDGNDPGTAAILLQYYDEDPGSIILIINENDDSNVWEKKPNGTWDGNSNRIYLYIQYQQFLGVYESPIPGDWGQVTFSGSDGGSEWYPLYTYATVCYPSGNGGQTCHSEWFIRGYYRV